jgi:hypothetical protein
MNKRNKIIILIIIIILFGVGIFGYLISKNSNGKKPLIEKSIEEQINDVIENSYIYYILYEKPVIASPDYLIYGDKIYYYVDAGKVNSLEAIDTLIDELFIDTSRTIKKELLFNKREFKEDNGKLYVYAENNDGCEVDYKLKTTGYSYEINDNMLGVTFTYEENSHTFTLYKKDNIYQVYEPIYACKYNFKRNN